MTKTLFKMILACIALIIPAFAQSAVETEILKVEDTFRTAKLQNDVNTLKAIVADEYIGINQYGVRRDKKEFIALFTSFHLSKLTRAEAEVAVTGDTAIVIGRQTEVNPAGREELMFSRVYIRRNGQWLLLSSTQLVPFNT